MENQKRKKTKEKGPQANCLKSLIFSGGADETRTRGLRRDRPNHKPRNAAYLNNFNRLYSSPPPQKARFARMKPRESHVSLGFGWPINRATLRRARRSVCGHFPIPMTGQFWPKGCRFPTQPGLSPPPLVSRQLCRLF